MTPEKLRKMIDESTLGPWEMRNSGSIKRVNGSLVLRDDRLMLGDTVLITTLRNHAEKFLELWEAADNCSAAMIHGRHCASETYSPYPQSTLPPCTCGHDDLKKALTALRGEE